jgi:hypothetical protein
LGGHYRYLFPGSRLGVHQFYVGEDAGLTVSEGVVISQLLAGEIVGFINEARVKAEFFSLISKVGPEDIYWVPEEKLRELHVATDSIYEQKAEYKNAEGHFYLLLWQQSYYGENKIVAACSQDGEMVFAAYIQPAGVHTFDHNDYTFEITLNGVAMPPRAAEPASGRDPRWVITHFVLEPYQLNAMKTAKSFGARHVHPVGVFLGFEYTIEDDKLFEMVSGCESPAQITGKGEESNRESSSSRQFGSPTLLDNPIFLPNIDLSDGDYNNNGIKGVEFEVCKQICLNTDNCVAVSWVERNGWCWPKHTASDLVPQEGIMSLIMRR